MGSSFTVALHRDGRPLVGARVMVTGVGDEFIAETGADGTYRFSALPPSDSYALGAGYMGFSVAWQCFHIREKPSRRARGLATFVWDPGFVDLWQMQGSIFDPNKWLTPRAKSGSDGRYGFAAVPDGEYALVSAAGAGPSGIEFHESRELVRLKASAVRTSLNLSLSNTSCGAYLSAAR